MTSAEQTQIETEIRLLNERDPDQAADLHRKLAARLANWNTVFELPGEAGELQRAFKPAQVKQTGKLLTAAPDLSPTGRPRVVARLSAEGPAQLDATFDTNWDAAPEVGLLLSIGVQQEYAFVLIAPDNRPEADKQKADSKPPTLADLRRRGADFVIEIQRNGTRLRGHSVPSEAVPRGPLHMRARRDGDTLVFRLNDIPELKFVDLFPLRAVEGNGYGVIWPAGVRIARLSAEHQLLPAFPSRLEQADELFLRGEWEAARRVYDEQARTEDVELRREADYKAALCWLQAGDDAEALARFGKLQQADAGNGKWPLRAGCQIWIVQLRHKEFEKAQAAFDALAALSVADEFAVVLSEQDRLAVVAAYSVSGVERLTADQRNLDRLERAEEVYKLVGAEMVWRIYTQADIIQMLQEKGDRARALEKAEQFMNEIPVGCIYDAQFLERYGTIARLPGGSLSDLTNPLRQVNRLLYKRPGVYRSDYYLSLLVERARLHAAQQDFIAAESDLDEFDRYRSANSDPLSNYLPRFAAEAGLVRGFLREVNGDAAGALAAWKAALATLRGAPTSEHADMNAHTVLCRTILASLTDTPLSDQEVDLCFRSLRTNLKGGSAALDGFLKNDQLFSGFVPRESIGHSLLGMWRSPRGRSVARGIALRNLSHRDVTLQPLLLALTEHTRREALSGATTQEQEALLWNFSERLAEGIFKGGLGPGDSIRLAYAWTRGGNDEFGWQGARKSKWLSSRPEVRGLVAYVIGQRFLQKGWPADGIFREAVKDAPAESSLARLAQFEVDHAAARKELAALAAEAKRAGGDPSTAEAAALRGRLLDFWRHHRDTPLGPAAFKLAADGVPWPADLVQRDRIPAEVLALAGLGSPHSPPERLVEVLGGPPAAHWEPIRALAVSPDAATLATGSIDGTIKLWGLTDGRHLRTLAGHVAAVVSLDFTRTGELLASGSDDGTCRVWSVADGAETLTLRGHSGRVSTLAFDPDGKQLVSGGWDGAVKVWELTTGLERHSLAAEMSEVHAVARVDENRLAVSHENGEVRLWDLADDRLVHKWAAHAGQARALATSSDGRQLVSGGADGKLRIWNLTESEQEPRTIDAAVAPHTVAFTADGQAIVTAGADGMARRFDAATGASQPPLPAKAYYAAAFDPRRNVLLGASLHNQVEQLDLATGELRPLIAGRAAALTVAWSSDGATLGATDADGAVRLWNVGTGQLARTLVDQGPPALSLAFHPHGRMLAAGKSDGTLALWETPGNEAPREWIGHAAQINRVAVSPDGKVLASAAHDGTVKLWTTADGLQIGECQGHKGAVTALSFASAGQTLATGGSEATPRLWDLTGNELLRAFEPGGAAIFDLAFNPLPGQLAAVGANGAITIWGLADGRIQAAYPAFLGRALAFSPDGRSLAVACNDGQVRFSDPGFFEPKLRVPESAFHIGPPTGIIRQAAYSPDGRHLALATGAGTVYVLRLESRGSR
jgi:WD40 repeat protein